MLPGIRRAVPPMNSFTTEDYFTLKYAMIRTTKKVESPSIDLPGTQSSVGAEFQFCDIHLLNPRCTHTDTW